MNKDIQKEICWSKLYEEARGITREHDLVFQKNNAEIPLSTTVHAAGITLNYAHQRITKNSLSLLYDLAHAVNLNTKIERLITGKITNISQRKPALHTALRAPTSKRIIYQGHNVMDDIAETKQTMRLISQKIQDRQWLGCTGHPITDIVHIGVGGSYLGPKFCIHALSQNALPTLRYHFIADSDPLTLTTILATLQPETSLFIIASKSFTTEETLINAQSAIAWMGLRNTTTHLIAITANTAAAKALGIQTILPIWDWVGGRYSVCSAINLITAIAIGFDAFETLLAGANDMDDHFLNTHFEYNLPILLALIGIWNINGLNTNNLLLLTYSKRLEYFTPYVQQLDMESNGKSIDNQGHPVPYKTGPIIWGGCGNQAQHSYYQLLCQGTQASTIDFISIETPEHELMNQFCKTKMLALSQGVRASHDKRHHIMGNTPFNHLSLNQCSPQTIGALIALYEHKVYAQSVLWDINPFDQPGIDCSKIIHRQRAEVV